MTAISGFLGDPFTFRQCCEVRGAVSLASLIQSILPNGRTAAAFLSPYPLSGVPSDRVVPTPSAFEQSIEQLAPGDPLVFLGYCGPRNGPDENEIATVASFITSLPDGMVAGAVDIPALLATLLYSGCGTIEGKIEAHCDDVKSVDLGGLLTYPLWAATAHRITYATDDQVALPLMAQVIEQRLMKYRILGAGMKLIVGRKS